jgi:hypothetical protein
MEGFMSYVQRVLQPGEVVRRMGSLHWYTYLPGLLCMLAAIGAIAWARDGFVWMAAEKEIDPIADPRLA